MATNWKAMQVAGSKKKGEELTNPGNVHPRYLSMGSWHASLSKGGESRKRGKSSYSGAVMKGK